MPRKKARKAAVNAANKKTVSKESLGKPDVLKSKMFYENRLESFENWPHKNVPCNAEKMAEAGFYYVKSKKAGDDCAKCYYCDKELDGWEPKDDPMKEHQKHAPYCPYVQLREKVDFFPISVYQAIDLENARIQLSIDKRFEAIVNAIQNDQSFYS